MPLRVRSMGAPVVSSGLGGALSDSLATLRAQLAKERSPLRRARWLPTRTTSGSEFDLAVARREIEEVVARLDVAVAEEKSATETTERARAQVRRQFTIKSGLS